MRSSTFAIAVLSAVLLGTAAQAQTPAPNPLDVVPEKMPFDVPYGAPITLERAQSAIAASLAEARKRDWKMSAAVVDSGGNLVAFARMDGAQLGSVATSEHKAHAAVLYRRDTKVFETNVQNGMVYQFTLDGMIGARAGIPLVENGKMIGAIGVAGGAGSQDEVAAKAGVATIQ